MLMPPVEMSGIDAGFPRDHARLISSSPPADIELGYRFKDLPEAIIRDLNVYGVCVLDDFLGEQRGKQVLAEVLTLYAEGKFTDGQLMRPPTPAAAQQQLRDRDQKQIRGDRITWICGREPGCANIGYLINQASLHSDCRLELRK